MTMTRKTWTKHPDHDRRHLIDPFEGCLTCQYTDALLRTIEDGKSECPWMSFEKAIVHLIHEIKDMAKPRKAELC